MALIAVAGLFASALYAGSVVRDVRSAPRYVTVKGFAQRPIRSDFVIWTGSLTARSPEMAKAYEKIEADLARVLAFLGEGGIAREQIAISPVSIQTRFRQGEQGYLTNEIELYELGQTLTLSSKDVARVETVSKEVTGLIRDGVELASNAPSFYYTGLDDLKIEMLGAAVGRRAAARGRDRRQDGREARQALLGHAGRLPDHARPLDRDLGRGHVRHFVDREDGARGRDGELRARLALAGLPGLAAGASRRVIR